MRVIYHGFGDEHRQKVLKRLRFKYDWTPVAICDDNYICGDNDGIVLIDGMALRTGMFDYKNLGNKVPVDASIVDALSKYELNVMAHFRDTTGWNFSFRERRDYYVELITYWNTVLLLLKPDIIVFSTAPHTPTSLPLYLISKHYYNIKTIYLDYIPYIDEKYSAVGFSIEDMSAQFMDKYMLNIDNEYGMSEMTTDVSTYLSKIRDNAAITPKYILGEYRAAEGYQYPLSLFKTFVQQFFKVAIKKQTYSDWKKNKNLFKCEKSRTGKLGESVFLFRLFIKSKILNRLYHSQCTKFNTDKKYVYFSASYQPEAISSINGGFYESTFAALDIISYVIPPDWVIYYKEHPYTFKNLSKSPLIKDKRFYQKLKNYNKVYMMSTDTDTVHLIDKSECVVTISGTVAWEAVVRGRPSISFGSAWYMGCKSIFMVKTLNDAKCAIEKIITGFSPDQTDINNYISAIEAVAVKGMVHYEFEKNILNSQNIQRELNKISDAIFEAHKVYYVKHKVLSWREDI